jgi:hypothetical protein
MGTDQPGNRERTMSGIIKAMTLAVFTLLLCALSSISALAQTGCNLNTSAALQQPCGETSKVSGNILGVDLSRGALEIYLTAVSYRMYFEVSVDDTGSFTLSAVPAGDYELFVSQAGEFVGVNMVSVSPGTSYLIFQLSNERQALRSGSASPHLECVRGFCHVHFNDAIG